jgi:superoxide dismutase, Fe-Mn family
MKVCYHRDRTLNNERTDQIMNISRRSAITGMVATGAAVIANSNEAFAQPAASARAIQPHTPKPLPFDPAKLTGISERLIKSHHENNYTGAVNALNVVEQRLATLLTEKDLPAYVYGELKREELIRTGSVVLHELYFGNLGGNGRADGKAADALKQHFGSVEAWELEFRKVAAALAGGSGWVVLAHNVHTNDLRNYWQADHAHNPPFCQPLLVLDMYEHAYQMDYGAAAAKYIDAFFQNINWEKVNQRVEAAHPVK